MEVTHSSEMFEFQRTTQHYILEDITVHNHCCKNLWSNTGGNMLACQMGWYWTTESNKIRLFDKKFIINLE
jgi:hypothetical protein